MGSDGFLVECSAVLWPKYLNNNFQPSPFIVILFITILFIVMPPQQYLSTKPYHHIPHPNTLQQYISILKWNTLLKLFISNLSSQTTSTKSLQPNLLNQIISTLPTHLKIPHPNTTPILVQLHPQKIKKEKYLFCIPLSKY